MPNIKAEINKHNSKLLRPQVTNEEIAPGCNCRDKNEPCPLGGLFIKLLSKKMIIQLIHTQGLRKIHLSRDIMGTQAASEIEMMTTQQPCHLSFGNSEMKIRIMT